MVGRVRRETIRPRSIARRTHPNAIPPVSLHSGPALGAQRWEDPDAEVPPNAALPERCVEGLRGQRAQQETDRLLARERWQETGLVFMSLVGTATNAANASAG